MADIALVFSRHGYGDLVLAGQDLARDDGLETAVLLSLFTDLRVSPEQLRPGEDRDDLRGWWGDIRPPVEGDQFGSLLWLLAREKQTPEVLEKARQWAQQALAWLLEDRVAQAVTVTAEYAGLGRMHLQAVIERPDASRETYRYDFEWAAQAAK